MRWAPALLALAALAAASRCGPDAQAAKTPGSATVTRLVDGDTLHVRIGGRDEDVRLLGIDTPETHKPNTPVECFGREASRHLAALLPRGTAVRLERDVEARDRYGRLLAYVYRQRDGLFVNAAMARDGYAAAYTYPPNVAHADQLVADAGEARDQNRGLWGACGGGHVAAS
jgi:micrococcal nuclease